MSLPLSLSAADSRPAILRAQGGVWVNGVEVADSTTIFPGDLLQTKPGFAGDLATDGSTILIQPESVVKYNGDSVTLEHGSVSVNTSKSLSVHVDCLRVIPVINEWTQYDVTNVNGNVQVNARKHDVNIEHGIARTRPDARSIDSQSATVKEGQQATRDASQVCGGPAKPKGAWFHVPAKWIGIGGAGGGGVILCALYCTGNNPPHVSPSTMSHP